MQLPVYSSFPNDSSQNKILWGEFQIIPLLHRFFLKSVSQINPHRQVPVSCASNHDAVSCLPCHCFLYNQSPFSCICSVSQPSPDHRNRQTWKPHTNQAFLQMCFLGYLSAFCIWIMSIWGEDLFYLRMSALTSKKKGEKFLLQKINHQVYNNMPL